MDRLGFSIARVAICVIVQVLCSSNTLCHHGIRIQNHTHKTGTSFIGSKETSDDAHTSEYIFEYVDGCIDTIGHQNVVQIVTDNASNNMGAKELMKAKRPNIFWSSCATHTINLMLQGIGNMPKYKKTLEQAKALTVFIYSHHKTLALMRKHTKRRDIIRPGVTRFASAFLTLQSLIEKKVELRAMALSKEWEESAHTKKGKGVTATATLISRSFWNGVNNALKVFEPLVKVLRMVDGDGPSMAFLYGEILEAKKKIKEALNNSESNYNLIINAIDGKMKRRLDSPLHLTAYLLNPYYSYGDRSIFLEQDIMDGFIECVEIFYHGNDEVMDQVLNVDFDIFKDKKETFGKTPARLGCQKRDLIPANWWSKYGCHVPHLQKFAIRILSLTSSSSGCERNWSTFDMVHTKKRNKLDAHRLNNLVYVQFNARLLNKKEKSNKKNIDVLLASHASNAQGWVIEGGDDDVDPETGLSWNLIDEAMGANEAMQPRRSTRVRELHEDDFDSESEEEEVNEDLENIEFEYDQDEVVPTKDYGQEDED